MRFANLGVLCLLSAACATGRRGGNSSLVSAAQLGLANCPQGVLTAVAGIDPSSDWRQVQDVGVSYCVPAAWSKSADRLRRNTRGPSIWWKGTRATVYADRSGTLDMDFPRAHLGPGTADNLYRGDIGGHAAEIFHRRQGYQSSDPAQARHEPALSGYETFALWRDQGLYFRGSAKDLDDITEIRAVFHTVRFDGSPGRD